jgi:hypothetical protein
MRDWIPENEAVLRKRGGWTYATVDLNSLSSGGVRVEGLCWAPFTGDPQLVAIGDNGKVYKITRYDAVGGSSIATSNPNITGQLFFHKDRVIIPAAVGTDVVPDKYINTVAIADVGGTPPNFSCGASWGDYIIGANGYVAAVRFPARAWWSGAGTPDVWSPSTSFWDFPSEINAVAPLSSTILFFGYDGVHLMTGDTPPPGGNFALKRYYFSQGTFDGRSVAKFKDYVVWANNTGVFRTDGATLTDLTESGGISLYYQALSRNFNRTTGWRAAGGIYRGNYFLSIHDNTGANVTTLVCDLGSLIWYEFMNIGALSYATRLGGPGTAFASGGEEMWMGWKGGMRAVNLSPLWTPSSANPNDADGTAVLPSLETPFYQLDIPAQKRVRRAYFTYDLRTAGGSPSFLVEKLTDPAGAYVACAENLPVTTRRSRRAVDVREKTQGVAFRLTQQVPSADSRLSQIDLELHGLEMSR